MVLANEISKTCKISQRKKSSTILNEPIGSQLPIETPLPHQHHFFFVAKISNWGMSEKMKSAIVKDNQKGKSAVFVSQIYSKSLRERRTATLKYQADLKELVNPRLCKIPSHTNDKTTGERKYSLQKEFWTTVFSKKFSF